jgi:hypothetical protein
MNRKYYAIDDIPSAIRFFNRTAGLELSDRRLYDEIRHFELRMLASRRELRLLAMQINKGIVFDATRSLDKMLFTALITESSGDTTTAKPYYRVLGAYNPYFEEGILAAAEFFRSHEPNGTTAYNILSEAIQVNAHSIKLLKAYFAEANRKGFDDYAASAAQRLQALMQDIH